MKFREQSTGQGQTHLDLVDELHKKEWVEFGPQNEGVSITRYREMVENLITELTEHNIILQKIKNGEVVNSEEAYHLVLNCCTKSAHTSPKTCCARFTKTAKHVFCSLFATFLALKS